MLPLLLVLTSCAGQEGPRESSAAMRVEVEAWTGDLPIVAPWLRDRLPAGVLAYQRVPNLMAMLAIPKGNMFDTALGSEANIRNLLNIRDALAADAGDEASLLANPVVQLLFEHLVSPIEVAAIGLPQVSGLVGMTLDLRSSAELEALFASLSQQASLPSLAGPIDAEGFGQIAAPVPIFLHFDEDTGRLALYGGPLATQPALAQLIAAPSQQAAHPMQILEAQIDQSGQGIFGWVDTSQALAMAPLFLPPETTQMMRVSGLDQLRALAYGAGVADGKGRLKLVADMGTNRDRRLIPVVSNRISATSVGEPRSLLVMSIPGPEEFARIENLAFSFFPPEIRGQWDGLKAEFAATAGASIEEILSAIGPELITIADRAGSYSGIKVRDPVLLDDVLSRLAASAEIAIDERRMGAQTIRHVTLPAAIGMPERADIPPPAAAMINTIGRMRSRFFWVDDGDYLYVAGMPQLLMDRASLGADTSVADWLANSQHVDLSNAFIGATGTVANLPRMMYQAYLALMQGLADMTEADFDVWSMPSATQLGLPERGTLGFSFNLGEPYLSLELTFESHPAEVLLAAGGGMAAVAAAGIAAAIALPAYQDYTIRAQVSEGLNVSAAVKAAVADAYLGGGTLPADRAAAGMAAAAEATSGAYVSGVEIDDGRVIVRFGNQANRQIAGRTLDLRPYLSANNDVIWVCGYASPGPGLEAGTSFPESGTTIAPQYLPSGCR
jgi:hypothetical protein